MMIDFDYLFSKYNIKATGVLHCGASTCQERDVYERLGVGEVIWVEAICEVYEKALLNLRGYQNQIILNACVSDETGRIVKFNISNNEAQSSSYLELAHHAIIHPEVHYVRQEEMVTIRLDELLSDYDVSKLNFLNMDIQGSELMALIGLGGMLNQFDYLYLEANKKEVYKGCALIGDLLNYLEPLGYVLVEEGTWVQDSWTDILLIKKDLIPS